MTEYNQKDWHFLNMNSPADLHAEYRDGTVTLSEYDGCRDGHALVSEFAVEENMYFSVKIDEIGQGAAIGLYYGDGCFSDYLLVAAQEGEITVRIPSGVPQGDTFRRQGALRYYTIVRAEYDCHSLSELAFRTEGHRMYVYADACRLSELDRKLPFAARGCPKLMVKALNETGQLRKAESVFTGYTVKGRAGGHPLVISCVEKDGKTPWRNGCVHLAGEFGKWTGTNDKGEACFDGLPFGEYRVVYGREGEEFGSAVLLHDGTVKQMTADTQTICPRENIPQENLKTDALYIGLNGLWSFELDRERVGEEEKWYLPGRHSFSRCIRVPFSWQSLTACGEEGLVNEYTLHQANSFLCTAEEVGETGWYSRRIHACWNGTTELVFAAVSGIGKVWLEGREIGCLTDSYNRRIFCLGNLEQDREYTLSVKVEYEHGSAVRCSGKQGFWFTDAPGIWQNVWLRERQQARIGELFVDYIIEETGTAVLKATAEMDLMGKEIETHRQGGNIKIPHCRKGMYKLRVSYACPYTNRFRLIIDGRTLPVPMEADAVSGEGIYDAVDIYLPLEEGTDEIELVSEWSGCRIIGTILEKVDLSSPVSFCWDNGEVCGTSDMQWHQESCKILAVFEFKLREWEAWSPQNPRLYNLSAGIVQESAHRVLRSVGIRTVGSSSFSKETGTYLTLNADKIYIRGVLDQGYNPWGLYTYPSLYGKEPGSAAYDIDAAMECGYNLMRMHIKDNEPDWYSLCDRKGMLVWDEIPCCFYGTAQDGHWQSMYRRQLRAAVRKHNYHPGVILCSTVNESWGISGDHEKSPWGDAAAQKLIKDYALYYKQHNPSALVIDNSGYGKTSETQVLDYHSYPHNFDDAHSFFFRLSEMNYPGSAFNCYNEENKTLMQDESILDLLQRTCSQNLKEMEFKGKEYQSGQPVLLSEFVHTDRQEELVRIFPGIAGYVRMNLASAENEDASPYTSTRRRRDFTAPGYRTVNGEDFFYMDLPFLSKKTAGENLTVPFYVSCWSDACEEGEALEVRFGFQVLSEEGSFQSLSAKTVLRGTLRKYTPYLLGEADISVPEDCTGGYLFADVYGSGEKRIGVTSVQFEIFPQKKNTVHRTERTEWNTAQCDAAEGFLYTGKVESDDRNLMWGFGKGSITYRIPAPGYRKGKLVLEASACDLLEGTLITDENAQDTHVEIFLNTNSLGKQKVKALTTDMRALFSNSSAGAESVVDYCKTGRFGYGSRLEIPFTLENTEENRELTIEIAASDRGVVLYGKRMGRYGSNPFVCRE